MQKLEDAVQPQQWYAALPREQYTTLELAYTDGWFEVYALPTGILAIYEPGHFQEVISFLVPGLDKAMLVDTGMGMGDIKAVVEKLTPLPVFVVNTHCHFDHIGGNHQFDEGYILDAPSAHWRSEHGISHADSVKQLTGDSLWKPAPAGFSPDTYESKPFPNWSFVQHGHVFDLGGRSFRVVATPGHSPDSIMLADDANKILFTGDTVYPATLYAHLESDDGMYSELEVYRRTMHRVAAAYDGYTLLCSHNEPLRPGTLLNDVAAAFDAVAEGTIPCETDRYSLKKYQFDGFALVTK
ncbi:MAG: MBL fold metallo-hydrolase [Oscillospiraceae bacterium]|nr:MBL fold metallo-hydrolase [Oscillospiraceae bacterium]